jgi:acetyltransferase-like isoleucine patch superfamily enzyme
MRVYAGKFLSSAALRELGVASVGDHVQVHETAQLVGMENMRLGDHVRVDAFSILSAPTGHVHIGSRVHVGAYCYLGGNAGITLADFSGLSQGVYIYSVSDDYSGASLTNPTVPKQLVKVHAAPVAVGRHAIIGARSVVLPGANIGEGCAVGAMSLVTRPTDPWGIYAGCPVRRLRDRSRALLESECDCR